MDKHGFFLIGFIAGVGLGISLGLGHANNWQAGGPIGGTLVFAILSLAVFGLGFMED